MIQLAVVYRTDAGETFVGIFNEDGDVEEFMQFVADKNFDALDLDKFGICEYQTSEESDFRLDMIAQVQVMINPKHSVDGKLDCTAEEFINDPEREPDSFKVMYRGVLAQMVGEADTLH